MVMFLNNEIFTGGEEGAIIYVTLWMAPKIYYTEWKNPETNTAHSMISLIYYCKNSKFILTEKWPVASGWKWCLWNDLKWPWENSEKRYKHNVEWCVITQEIFMSTIEYVFKIDKF
jgi:hypothetical protein